MDCEEILMEIKHKKHDLFDDDYDVYDYKSDFNKWLEEREKLIEEKYNEDK